MADLFTRFIDLDEAADRNSRCGFIGMRRDGGAGMAWPGERAKFERLVLEHLPAALRFATRLTGSPDEAEDLLQDAMLRVSKSWKSFRGESEFRTWLFRIVINCFRDRPVRRRTTSLSDELADEPGASPTDMAMANELGSKIAALVSELPARQREVLILNSYEGLSPRDIAALLDISEPNVHATLHVARRRLREQLAPYLAESK